MKPELISYFRHLLAIEGMDTSLGSAELYFKTLTPDAILAIVSSTTIDKQKIYNDLGAMLSRLVFNHGPNWTIHQYIPSELKNFDMSKEKCSWLRIIGDTHGKLDKLLHLSSQAEYSLCVGDVGFDYSDLTRCADPTKLCCVGGNHDNYNKVSCVNCLGEDCVVCQGRGYIYCDQSKHFLGDYGLWQPPEFDPIFFFRGAWSIDYKYRIPCISWWEDEEMSYGQMLKAFNFYKEKKPKIVVSHTAPFCIIPSIPFRKIFGDVIHKQKTEEMLHQMYDEWQPDIHFFGHWHCDFAKCFEHPTTNKKTWFICLAELSYIDLPKNFKVTDDFVPKRFTSDKIVVE